MKKTIALLLVLCTLACGMLLPAGAGTQKISLRLNSDIAGCMASDAEKLLEIRSGPVTYYEGSGGAIFIADNAGGAEYAHMDAGRTYTITYTLAAVPGAALSQTLADGDVTLDCGKGVSVISCRIIELYTPGQASAPGNAGTERVLRITAKVVVDGTALQRFIGWLRDLLLKLRAWSLY